MNSICVSLPSGITVHSMWKMRTSLFDRISMLHEYWPAEFTVNVIGSSTKLSVNTKLFEVADRKSIIRQMYESGHCEVGTVVSYTSASQINSLIHKCFLVILFNPLTPVCLSLDMLLFLIYKIILNKFERTNCEHFYCMAFITKNDSFVKLFFQNLHYNVETPNN